MQGRHEAFGSGLYMVSLRFRYAVKEIAVLVSAGLRGSNVLEQSAVPRPC